MSEQAEEFLNNRIEQLRYKKRTNLREMSAYIDDITDAMEQYAKEAFKAGYNYGFQEAGIEMNLTEINPYPDFDEWLGGTK